MLLTTAFFFLLEKESFVLILIKALTWRFGDFKPMNSQQLCRDLLLL